MKRRDRNIDARSQEGYKCSNIPDSAKKDHRQGPLVVVFIHTSKLGQCCWYHKNNRGPVENNAHFPFQKLSGQDIWTLRIVDLRKGRIRVILNHLCDISII